MTIRVLKPHALQPGDLVQIVAPASNIKPENLTRGTAELTSLGFRVKFDPAILEQSRYTAGTDERRRAELMDAFTDPDVKAVWAARGGYGVMRILALLDQATLAATPKIFIGYSDLTALQLFLWKRFGWITFHGPMAAKDLAGGDEHYDRQCLVRTLCEPAPPGTLPSTGTVMLHSGKVVQGRLVGGCLSIVSAMMGTPDELDADDALLFLEDTATRPYQIDRMLQQLRLAGKLDRIRGIIFGEMNDCNQHPAQGYTIQELLRDLTADLGVPVMFGLRSGHSNIGNLTLPLGAMATLDPAQCTLSIDEAAVQ